MESMDVYELNRYGERIELGEIILNLDYWDCECRHNFIHSITQQQCEVCSSEQEDCPSSREEEVNIFLGRNYK